MTAASALRLAAAAALAVGGASLSVAAGAPLAASLLAWLAGVGGGAILLAYRSDAPAAPAQAEDSSMAADEAALPRLDDVLNAVDEPVLIVRERRVVAANAAAGALLGAHVQGSDLRLAIRDPAAADLLAAQSEGRTELVGLGEPDRHWEMRVSPLDDGSRLVRLADQSETRAAEQMRVDFVANASHELRTPLATLLGFLETLGEEEAVSDPATRARFVTIMFDEAVRMRQLLDDLMSLSRIEAERFAVPREPVDLLPLLRSACDGVEALAGARGCDLVIENEARTTRVRGDRAQLAQLFSNLVTNALNYGRAGAPVRMRLEDEGGDMVEVSVIDEGEGIPAEHIPRLTERFYRVDAGRSRAVGGTGLGLAIAKHIALRHRGRLEIRSRVGAGTTVSVSLPIADEDGATVT